MVTRSCKVLAAHREDNNVRVCPKIVKIPKPQDDTLRHKKRWTQLVLGSTHRHWSPLTSLGNWWSVIDVGRSSKSQRLPASITYYHLPTDVSKSRVVIHLCLEWAQVPTFWNLPSTYMSSRIPNSYVIWLPYLGNGDRYEKMFLPAENHLFPPSWCFLEKPYMSRKCSKPPFPSCHSSNGSHCRLKFPIRVFGTFVSMIVQVVRYFTLPSGTRQWFDTLYFQHFFYNQLW